MAPRLLILTLVLAISADAQTRIRDTVYQADGSLFQGDLRITWQSFSVGPKRVAAGQRAIKISHGYLDVTLEPNELAEPGGTRYLARWTSATGQFLSEYWLVPASSVAVKLQHVIAPSTTRLEPAPVHIDLETPVGVINGVNRTFTLGQTPYPDSSLLLFVDGVLAMRGIHYDLAASTITFTESAVPGVGAQIRASYRYNLRWGIASAGGGVSSGEQGPPGPEGPQGEPGPVGPEGPQGETGPAGPVGPQGDAGPAGPQGEAGPAGPAGPQGETGLAGPAGPQGETGPAGPAGPQGVQGPAGPAGPQGDTGLTGSQGPTGPIGPVGLTGPIGPVGPQGEAGPGDPNALVTFTDQTVVQISHDRNTEAVLVKCYDSAKRTVEPEDVEIISANLVEVRFAVAQTGSCALNTSGGSSGTPQVFVDDETPTGLIDGANRIFGLSQAPTPASVKLYLTGILLRQGVDYVLSGSTITLTEENTPQAGDQLVAFYRVAP